MSDGGRDDEGGGAGGEPRARAAGRPCGRARRLIALAGLVGSLGLEVLAAVGLEWRDPVITSAQGLEGLAGVGVLGSLPRIS